MRNLFISLLFLMVATTVETYSQIKVPSNGNVMLSSLQVPSYPVENIGWAIRFQATEGQTPFQGMRIKLNNGDPRIEASTKIVFYRNDIADYLNIQAKNVSIPSDTTLKKNITMMNTSEALNKVLGISSIQYNWKKGDQKRETGLIAQEIAQVMPELVTTNDTSGVMLVSYMNLIPYLISSVQEQNKIIRNFENQIAALAKNSQDFTTTFEGSLEDAIPNPTDQVT
jgi:hypothetical protein